MMVESSPSSKNMERLLNHLDRASSQMHALQEKARTQPVSQNEYKNLIKILKQFNTQLPQDPSSLKSKDLAPKEMQKHIEQALKELQLFKDSHFGAGKAGLKNVEAAIVSLFSSLKEEVKVFDRNLRNLSVLKDEYEQLKYKVTKSSRTKNA